MGICPMGTHMPIGNAHAGAPHVHAPRHAGAATGHGRGLRNCGSPGGRRRPGHIRLWDLRSIPKRPRGCMAAQWVVPWAASRGALWAVCVADLQPILGPRCAVLSEFIIAFRQPQVQTMKSDWGMGEHVCTCHKSHDIDRCKSIETILCINCTCNYSFFCCLILSLMSLSMVITSARGASLRDFL